MESNAELLAFTALKRLFKERGLPRAIRFDNGIGREATCAPLRKPHQQDHR